MLAGLLTGLLTGRILLRPCLFLALLGNLVACLLHTGLRLLRLFGGRRLLGLLLRLLLRLFERLLRLLRIALAHRLRRVVERPGQFWAGRACRIGLPFERIGGARTLFGIHRGGAVCQIAEFVGGLPGLWAIGIVLTIKILERARHLFERSLTRGGILRQTTLDRLLGGREIGERLLTRAIAIAQFLLERRKFRIEPRAVGITERRVGHDIAALLGDLVSSALQLGLDGGAVSEQLGLRVGQQGRDRREHEQQRGETERPPVGA